MLTKQPFLRAFLICTTMVFTAVTLSACASGQLPVTRVYQSSQCAVADKTLRLLNSPEEVAEVLAPQFPDLGPNTSESIPDINFSDEQPVLIAWGRQGNAGYRIELDKNEARIENGTVLLPVRFEQPDPDKMQAQVMTSACLIVTLPKEGYTKIIAGDLETRRD